MSQMFVQIDASCHESTITVPDIISVNIMDGGNGTTYQAGIPRLSETTPVQIDLLGIEKIIPLADGSALLFKEPYGDEILEPMGLSINILKEIDGRDFSPPRTLYTRQPPSFFLAVAPEVFGLLHFSDEKSVLYARDYFSKLLKTVTDLSTIRRDMFRETPEEIFAIFGVPFPDNNNPSLEPEPG